MQVRVQTMHLFISTNSYDEQLSNTHQALDIIKKSELKEEVKQKLYELLEFDIDSKMALLGAPLTWTWKDLLDSVEDIAPPCSNVPEVTLLKLTLKDICDNQY